MHEIMSSKLSSLSEISKAQLSKILKSVPGTKDLTLESRIIKPLERICGVSWLKSNSIEKIFKLDAASSTNRPNLQFFMIFTNLETFHTLLQQVQSLIDVNAPPNNKFHVICVPKSLYAFDEVIEEQGLWNVVKLYSFQWMPMHLDQRILSLELHSMFRDVYVREDYSLLPAYAKSLWQLFLTFGRPNFCLTIGRYAKIVLKQLDQLKECKVGESEFGGCVIIDRTADYPSALMTPGTYAAILHDIVKVECGVCNEESPQEPKIQLDAQSKKITQKSTISFVLDSNKDAVYNLIKDKYFTQVTDILRHLTKDLKVQGTTSDMALHEIKTYVQTKLQSVTLQKKLISNHLNIAEIMVKFLQKFERLMEVEGNILLNNNKSKSVQGLEDYLQSESDRERSFALFLLLCHTQKLTDSEAKSFLNHFFIEFGFSQAIVYRNLLKAGIIEPLSTSKLKLPQIVSLNRDKNFYSNAAKLKQTVPEPERINLKAPTCSSYVFGGTYIPLVAQITSLILSGCPLDDIKAKCSHLDEVDIRGQYQSSKKSILVYVLGGITYSEISALNLLESLMNVTIVKISDRIISKHHIAEAFLQI